MGNSYSVAQEEQEEAEFERLVRAVERAQRGESPVPRDRDLEAQYRYGEPEEGPPRSEKVMMWFKANRGNHATIQAELEPSPVHPVATPAGIPNSVALERTSGPPSIVCQPPSPSPQTPRTSTSTSPVPVVICCPPSPAAPTTPSISGEPSGRSVRSSISADSSSHCQEGFWYCPPVRARPEETIAVQHAETEPIENDEGRADDDDDKRSNPSVDGPPSLVVPHRPPPAAPVQAIITPSERPPSVVHVPPTAQVGLPCIVPVLPSAISPSWFSSPVFGAPHTELRGRSRSRSPQRDHSRSRSRSRGPVWSPRDSLSDFRDLFYRPAPQRERSPSPDVSRGRSPVRRHGHSQRTSPAPATPAAYEASSGQDRVSPVCPSHSRSPSLYRGGRHVWRSRSPSRQAASRSRLSRSPDNQDLDRYHYDSEYSRRSKRPQELEQDYSRHRPPVPHSVQSQPNARRAPSHQDIDIADRPTERRYRRSRSRSRSWSPSRRPCRPGTRTPSPPSVRQGSSSGRKYSRSPSLRYIPVPGSRNTRRRTPGDVYDDDWRRSRSSPLVQPSVQSQHNVVHYEPSPEGSNVSSASPSYRPSRTPFQEGRSPSPRTVDDRDANIDIGAPRIPISVYDRSSWRRPPSPRAPIIVIPPPPREQGPSPRPPLWSTPSRNHTRSRSPRTRRPDKDKFEQVLQLYENTLLAHERRAELWHEHSKQLVGVVRRLEKHLVALRWHSHKYHSSSASADSLPLSLLDIADEKGGAAVHLQSLAHAYAGPGPTHWQGKPYLSRPYAAGLPVRRCSDDWQPKWDVFPLKAFRGPSYTYLKIHAGWDDAALLWELGRSYDTLRTVWRKWFSLRSVRSISMVYADHTCVYPRRIGPAGVSPSKNMRLRYFLRHPDQMKDRHEFMQVLTARTDLGIEFVEGWQLSRIAVAILLPVLASLVLAVLYSGLYGDVSGAFTIAGYMTSAYSVCLVLLGLLNFVEF